MFKYQIVAGNVLGETSNNLFYRSADGSLVEVDSDNRGQDARQTIIGALLDDGTILADTQNFGAATIGVVRWHPEDGLSEIGPNGSVLRGYAASGQLIGSSPTGVFAWTESGGTEMLAPFPSEFSPAVLGLNNRGTIVGWGPRQGQSAAAYWSRPVDTDGDGSSNTVDNCLFAENGDQADLDGDGLGDVCDTDQDGDGTPDATDAFPRDPLEQLDTDLDGIGDNADLDDDGDGLSDADETVLGTNPLRADTDGDGLDDAEELELGFDPLDPTSCPEALCPPDGSVLRVILDALTPESP